MELAGKYSAGFLLYSLMRQFIYVPQMRYSKTCVKRPLKIVKSILILITNGSLMKVKSIAECSP